MMKVLQEIIVREHAPKAECKWCNDDDPEERLYEDWEICEDCKKEALENEFDMKIARFL